MTEFQLSIPAYVLIINIGILIGLAILGIVIWFYSEVKGKTVATGIIGIIFILFIYLLLIAPMQTKVVSNDAVEVSIPPYIHEIIQKEEVMRGYIIVDWEYNESLKPKYKKYGAGMGSYKIGWYRLVNGRDAIIMTAGTKVVCLELKDKYVMMAPDRFDEFVKELNEKFITIQ